MDRRLGFVLAFCLVVGCTRKPSEPAGTETVPEVTVPAVAKFDEPFTKAVTDEVGPDQRPPVERTISGKSTAAIREAVEKSWPAIQVAANDKPLPWVVTLETEAGTFEIALRADLAPNHVRNFLALIQAGYYDGLRFDRIVHQEAESPDGVKSEIRMVRFGCPAGTGDSGVGHLGYRLRSEFSDQKHEAGTVGFSRDADPSSAGTRLYITLGPAPILDGSYTIVGKVSKGLDVVEKIARGRLLSPDLDPSRELPERPIAIQRMSANDGQR